MIIVQTPLRISLFGGGTDFPDFFCQEGGCVLSTSINKYIFVIIKERYDDLIRIGYTRTEIVNQLDEIQHEIIREAMRKTGVAKGIEIITMGDIPAGSGLGSSSTVTVGTLHALYTYQKQAISQERLAKDACEIEVDILQKPIGYQDQYIAAYGGLRFFEFLTNGKVNTNSLTLQDGLHNKLNEHLLLFSIGKTRMSESILTEQKKNIQGKRKILLEIKRIAYEARDAICKGELDTIGYLLDESWQLKKQLASGISNDSLDDAYTIAIKAGALGGKVAGAGGGGFLMLFVPPGKRDSVRRALTHLKELPFQLEKDGSKTILNYQY
jgi:D-glycero-alpha-D-manno-heptose-7-phosphate kinase